ncbi:MAG: Smr/MutS family protein [Myxococcaceae bacterium]|nr:Smr/MutS family protein [Myxococcaceae bacterium]
MSKKQQPFNNPFGALKLEAPKKAEPQPAPKAAAVVHTGKSKRAADDDTALFLESVGEVAPVKAKVERVAPRVPPSAEQLKFPTEEAESLARLAELVSSEGTFEVSDSEAFIEGAVQGFDERVRRQLRKGAFAFKARLDLHGRTRDEAKPALERFLADAKLAGHRCVLVVTGRGLHSEDAVPVLKRSVQEWLTHGRPARQVLAFCSARPEDGGTGALYVLLRR